ncbi:hypothetical protein FQA39_LY03981 [Lamprigera yunnana]|nr:hypothetical protein FQA39_LY03981 [Lamprigera yunnana]
MRVTNELLKQVKVNSRPRTATNRDLKETEMAEIHNKTSDAMWKPGQIGSKTLTFEMIEEKKILRIENMCGNEVYLGWESVSKEIQFIKKKWMFYAEQHWTKAIDLKSAVERLYEKLRVLEFDADHEAIYEMERYYMV